MPLDALQISTPLHPHFEILRRWHAVAEHQEILRRRRNGVNQSLFHRSPWFITLGHVNYVVHVKSFSELHHWIMPRKSLVAFRISPHPLPIHFLSPRSTTFTKFYHIPEVTPLMSGQVQLLKKKKPCNIRRILSCSPSSTPNVRFGAAFRKQCNIDLSHGCHMTVVSAMVRLSSPNGRVGTKI